MEMAGSVGRCSVRSGRHGGAGMPRTGNAMFICRSIAGNIGAVGSFYKMSVGPLPFPR
jgi:hypothetical protein